MSARHRLLGTIDRRIPRELRAMRLTTIAIVSVIVIGVASFTSMTTAHRDLERARIAYDDACRLADVVYDLRSAPLSLVDRVRAIDGVLEVRPRVLSEATLPDAGLDGPLRATIVSIPAGRDGILNGVVPMRGTGLAIGDVDEAVIDDTFARARGIEPGDDLDVVIEGRLATLRVVGTALSSEFAYMMAPGSLVPDPGRQGLIWLDDRVARRVAGLDGACNQLLVRIAPDAPLARPAIERLLEPTGLLLATEREDLVSVQILDGELAQLRATAIVLPTILLGVAALVLNILMMRLAAEQRSTIGVLKAIGVPDRILVRQHVALGVIVAALGCLVGIPLGAWLARETLVMYDDFFAFPSLRATAAPDVWIVAIAAAAAAAIIGSARGARAVMRLEPAAAMRPAPPPSGRRATGDLPGLSRLRLSLRWRLALRSLVRNPGRAGATVVAAAVGGSLVCATLLLLATMQGMLRTQFGSMMLATHEIALREPVDAAVATELRRQPAVEHVELQLDAPVELRNGHRMRRTSVSGIDPGALLSRPQSRDARALRVPASGLLLDRHVARDLAVGVGDLLEMRPIRGDRTPRTVRIAGLSDGFIGSTVWADRAWLSRELGESDAFSRAQVILARDPERRRALFSVLNESPLVTAIDDRGRVRTRVREVFLGALWSFVGVLLAMAGAIFFGSVVTVSLVSIAERRRELATFLAMGMPREWVGGILLRESFLLNAMGGVLGLPVGWWLADALVRTQASDAFRMTLQWNWLSIGATLALCTGFTTLAHGLVERVLGRFDWRTAISSKE